MTFNVDMKERQQVASPSVKSRNRQSITAEGAQLM
jgi:hypothetical protein